MSMQPFDLNLTLYVRILFLLILQAYNPIFYRLFDQEPFMGDGQIFSQH